MAFFTLKTYLIVWNLAQYFALACARRGTFTAAITFEARARTVNLDILVGRIIGARLWQALLQRRPFQGQHGAVNGLAAMVTHLCHQHR